MGGDEWYLVDGRSRRAQGLCPCWQWLVGGFGYGWHIGTPRPSKVRPSVLVEAYFLTFCGYVAVAGAATPFCSFSGGKPCSI